MTSPLGSLRLAVNALMGGRPFLRRTAGEDYLLVSDAPQRLREPEDALRQLAEAGFTVAASGNLWHLDAPLNWYAALSQSLPDHLPPMPEKEEHLPVWSLCRMLLDHPSPLEAQPLSLVRPALKAIEAGEAEVLRLADSLPPRLAALLRKKEPLPALTGRLLAGWLVAKARKETAQ